MITVACVLKTGGDFGPAYVERLGAGVHRMLGMPHRFVCLTDVPVEQFIWGGVPDMVIPLTQNWPGWWSKMEVFALPGPILYFDLDTIITGPIDILANWIMRADDNTLLMLRDFYRRNEASGILGWHSDMGLILRDFRDNYAVKANWQKGSRVISMRAKGVRFQGDQDWLRVFLRGHSQVSTVMAQDVQSGLYSYKVHVQKSEGLPDDASVVCFHGLPRPHEVNPCPEWMLTHWHGTVGAADSTRIATKVRDD